MNIEEIIFSTPIPKDKELVDSVEFLKILKVKYEKLHSLIMQEDSLTTILPVLTDFENVEVIITNADNLTFLRYTIGTKYVELGLKYDKDDYLQKGISKLELLDEETLSNDALRADYYRLYSRAILVHFNYELAKNSDYSYTYESIEPLLKSKYFLFKLYNYLVEKRIKPTDSVETKFTTDLVSCLIYLSRWSEPFYILDKSAAVSKNNNEYINYQKAHVLIEISRYTCCGIYSSMFFEVKRFLKIAESKKNSDKPWNDNLKRINNDADEVIEEYNLNLKEFENAYGNTSKDIEDHTQYRKWVLKNHFSLCEHAVFCFCGLSKSDDLFIKTNHKHTHIEWVNQFELVLDKIKAEYNLARYFLFLSEDESRLLYSRNDEVQINTPISSVLNNSNSDYLIQSFKSAYSILDKIARAIYAALEIQEKEIYFHKCWKKIKKERPDNRNRYLYTLYSIACDLSDSSKYSAFQEYKKWRNLIEHEYFFLINDKSIAKEVVKKMPIVKDVVQVDEFKAKTNNMLQLCRSAIFSFIFFIRHESRQKAKSTNDDCLSNRITEP